MPNLQDQLLHTLPAEAYGLVVVFGRFEYAMKQEGFRQRDKAQAAWERFADSMPADFFEKMAADKHAKAIFLAPPKYLVPKAEGKVGWSDPLPIPNSNTSLFNCVKTVRNNLLHGDKHIGRQRDTDLISASLYILNSAYESVSNDEAFLSFVERLRHDLD